MLSPRSLLRLIKSWQQVTADYLRVLPKRLLARPRAIRLGCAIHAKTKADAESLAGRLRRQRRVVTVFRDTRKRAWVLLTAEKRFRSLTIESVNAWVRQMASTAARSNATFKGWSFHYLRSRDLAPSGEPQVVNADLRSATFECWVAFIFDHPTIPEDAPEAGDKQWYWELGEVQVDPRKQVRYMTTLFRRAAGLPDRYTLLQVDQGFWFMFGPGGHDHFARHLWNAQVPWAERRRCISAIAYLYNQLFGPTDVGSSGFMLWDLLASDYDFANRHLRTNRDDRRVQRVMLHTLARMLGSRHSSTQLAALHGLYHLRHKDGNDLVRRFLRTRRPIDDEAHRYAKNVLAGRVM